MSQHKLPRDAQQHVPDSVAENRESDQKVDKPATAREHRRPIVRVLHALAWVGFSLLFLGVVLGIAFLVATLNPYYLPGGRSTPTRIYASDGRVLARLFDEYRIPVRLRDVPMHTLHAILAAEDAHYFQHKGLDGRGMLRAFWVDLRALRPLQGGSTITQQLVRLNLLDDRRTLIRKIRECVLAVRVERAYSKEEILERYLNAIYFGGGAYGIGAAAQNYFGKSVSQLTPAESAMLAGMIRAPGDGNPRENLQLAAARQRRILAAMQRHLWLSADEYTAARHETLHIVPAQPILWRYPYVVAAVRRQLLAEYGRDVVYRGGLSIYTTIDTQLQQVAENALSQAVSQGRDRHVGTGALVAVEPGTGYIRAMVGGVDYVNNQYDHAMQARRQPGSAFKTFVYQAALDHGHLLTDKSLDAPVTVGNWSPQNFGGIYHGNVTLDTALAESLNSVAVRLTNELSPLAVVVAANQAGITSRLAADMTLALGTSDVTPLEMARAFATYANGGKSVDPTLITEIRAGKQVLFHHAPWARQAVSPVTTFLLTQGLRDVIAAGTGRRADIGRPAAGKTGTSNDYRDAWFIGYTPFLSTAVWMGNDDFSPMMGVAGGDLPAQVWATFMREAHRTLPPTTFAVPEGIMQVKLCADSGLLALPTCPHTVLEYLPTTRVPDQQCMTHYWVQRSICVESGKLATPACPLTRMQTFPYYDVPTEKCPLTEHVLPKPLETPAPTIIKPAPEQPVPEIEKPAPPTSRVHRSAPPAPEIETPATPAPRIHRPVAPAPEIETPATPAPRVHRHVPTAPRVETPIAPAHPRPRRHEHTRTPPAPIHRTHPRPAVPHPTPRAVQPPPAVHTPPAQPSADNDPPAKRLPAEKSSHYHEDDGSTPDSGG